LHPGLHWDGLALVDDPSRFTEADVAASRAQQFGEWLDRLVQSSSGGSLAEQLERRVLGGERCCTRAEIERRSGVPPERTERLWQALGFADVGDEDVVFTDIDVEALRLMNMLIGSGLLDPTLEVGAVRAAGQALSRLAEWELGLLNDYVVTRVGTAQLSVDQTTVLRFADMILPTLERLHSYIWRRHLAALTGRLLAATPQELVTTTVVVGFVDVVGYTNLTRHVTERDLARLIERFESTAVGVVATGGGRVVKTLGDEVMFVADDPVGGSAIGLRMLDAIGVDQELPDVRIGMAFGHVLRRFGDVYGPVVNIASRLTTAAKPGTVLVDRELATVLAEEPTMGLRRRRPISVRGYNRLSPWRLTWALP
jgi:adenylate cyclase